MHRGGTGGIQLGAAAAAAAAAVDAAVAAATAAVRGSLSLPVPRCRVLDVARDVPRDVAVEGALAQQRAKRGDRVEPAAAERAQARGGEDDLGFEAESSVVV
jgi:hypothetical protein